MSITRSLTQPLTRAITRSITQAGAGGGGAPFDPLSVSPMAWYDVSDISTLWQDSGRTTPVTTAGQTVVVVDDKSGNGRHCTFTGLMSTYRVDAYGNPYLETYSSPGRSAFNLTGACYIAYAGCVRENADNHMFGVFKSDDSEGFSLNGQKSNGSFFSQFFADGSGYQAFYSDPGAFPFDTPSVCEYWAIPGEHGHAYNAMETPRTSANTLNSGHVITNGAVCIGGTGTGNGANGKFYGAIVCDSVPAQRQQVGAYLAGICGVGDLWGQSYDLFLVAGQSNSMATPGGALSAITLNYGDGAEYCGQRGFVKSASDAFRAGDGGSATPCSAWPSFCKEYFAQTGRRALITAAGISGMGLLTNNGGGWAGNASHRAQAGGYLSDAKAYIESKGGSVTVRGIIWLGGENDAEAAVTKATWKPAFVSFLDQMESASGFTGLQVFAMSIDDRATYEAAYSEIRDAISEVCTAEADFHLVMPYQNFRGAGKLADAVHWNETALREAGVLAAQGVATALGL